MRPSVGFWSSITVRDSVDLPQPDSPTSPRISPFSTDSDTPSTATTGADLRAESSPCTAGKTTLT